MLGADFASFSAIIEQKLTATMQFLLTAHTLQCYHVWPIHLHETSFTASPMFVDCKLAYLSSLLLLVLACSLAKCAGHLASTYNSVRVSYTLNKPSTPHTASSSAHHMSMLLQIKDYGYIPGTLPDANCFGAASSSSSSSYVASSPISNSQPVPAVFVSRITELSRSAFPTGPAPDASSNTVALGPASSSSASQVGRLLTQSLDVACMQTVVASSF